VIQKSDEFITLYNGNDIVPKFELLKATALGRQDGYEAYKKALNYVALTYPNSEEGKQAQIIYSTTIPNLAFKNFVPEEESTKFKLVYTFNANEGDNISAIKKEIDIAIEYYNYNANMFTSVDYYNASTKILVIHGLKSKLGAEGFGSVLASPQEKARKDKISSITRGYVGISSDNYKIVQIHKNLDIYQAEAID
jgi:hypothetical protein